MCILKRLSKADIPGVIQLIEYTSYRLVPDMSMFFPEIGPAKAGIILFQCSKGLYVGFQESCNSISARRYVSFIIVINSVMVVILSNLELSSLASASDNIISL